VADQKLGFIITAKDLASKEMAKVNGEITKMEKSTKGAKTGVGGLLSTVGPMKIAMLGAGAGAVVLAEGLSIAINAASDLRESVSLTDSVFEENSKEMQDWAAGAAQAFGQSKREALDFASNFGNAFKNVGFDLDEASDKAKEMTRLAADLGSAFNAGADEAALALRSGLLGESEPLRRFGVFLSEAATQAKALQLGIVKAGQKLTDAQKVTARYAIIMEDTAAIQGMFGKDTGSLADAQKRLGSATENLAAKLGGALIPMLADVVTLASKATLALDDMADESDDAGVIWAKLAQANPFVQIGVSIRRMANDITGAADDSGTALDELAGKARDDLNFAGLSGKARDDLVKISGAIKDVGATYRDTSADIEAITADLIDKAFDPLSIKMDLIATNAEVTAARREVAANEALRSQAEGLAEMARTGQKGSQVYKDGVASLKLAVKNATGPTKTYLQGVLTSIENIETEGRSVPINLMPKLFAGGSGWMGGARAGGGPVEANKAYMVGEEGPELFVPGTGGMIVPNSGTAAATSFGSGMTINFNSVWPPSREQAREIARVVDEALHPVLQRSAPTAGRT
jgi:hypothetical protein